METMQLYELLSINDGDIFRDTLEVLLKAQHPCVIAIRGAFLPTRASCGRILLEYATGGTLSEFRLELQYPTGYDELFYVSLCVCRLKLAMRFLHSRGIKHYHLDPSQTRQSSVPCVL